MMDTKMNVKYSLAALLAIASLNAQEILLDTASVTATKIVTPTKEISQSIAVVDEKTIEDKNILNVQEAIENIPGVNAESSTNSPSPRLIIRGAGLKARYGVREVMVMKDGVPLTDPDSFTRFDFIDMQDVSSIEVQKGPGSINAVNATGGVIQLITKSVFEEDKNMVKLGAGDDGQRNLNLKVRGAIDDNDFASVTFSTRKIDNDWRDNNAFDATQVSLKHGHIFEDDSSLETEFSYTESNMKIPTSMTDSEFQTFKATGEQHNTSSPWQHSARDSKIFALNTKYEKEVGNITYKPRFYFNTWEHFHPVTAMINDSDDNKVFGTDLEANYFHKAFGNDATLVFGVTVKQDITKDSKKYTYADFTDLPGPSTAISTTLSNNRGDLANIEDSKSTLYGIYAQETFKPTEKLSVDFSLRVDRIDFSVDGDEILQYNWSGFSGPSTYFAGDGVYSLDESYTLMSPKAGLVYAVTESTNVYTSVAQANQAPTGSEINANTALGKPGLDKTTSRNYEVGVKHRSSDMSYDVAIYQNDVTDEITAIKEGWTTFYENAGKTRKRGFEFNGAYQLHKNVQLGASYAYSDFEFVEFMEEGTEDRAGNSLPYIPEHQYSMFATLNLPNGFKSRITTKSWGSYYMDNANTQKYEGYDLVTDLMIGYETAEHSLQLNIKNIMDEHYAMQADRDIDGVNSYNAAAPRSYMLTYSYKF
jgi:iron complex outermembrane receptor protein